MKLNVTRDDILNNNLYKGIFKMALPLMLLNLINTLYQVVDTYFVGKIGELQVGAVSLVSPIVSCFNAFAIGLSAAGIAMIARSLGQNNKDKANNIATHLIVLAIGLGFALSALCFVFRTVLLSWLDTPLDIYIHSGRKPADL